MYIGKSQISAVHSAYVLFSLSGLQSTVHSAVFSASVRPTGVQCKIRYTIYFG